MNLGKILSNHPHTLGERWFIARTYFGLTEEQFEGYEQAWFVIRGPKNDR